MRARLPYFVYGTLRPGHGNARLWHGLARAEGDGVATVSGYRLVSNGYFPYAVPTSGYAIVGTLVFPAAEHADEVKDRLDMLEGYPDHYDRRLVLVRSGGRRDLAIMYVPGRLTLEHAASLPTVESGDWNARNPRSEHNFA